MKIIKLKENIEALKALVMALEIYTCVRVKELTQVSSETMCCFCLDSGDGFRCGLVLEFFEDLRSKTLVGHNKPQG